MAAAVDWHAQSKGLEFRSQAFIGGKYVPAASGETFEDISPIDGNLLARVAACDKEDVDRAAKAARAAFSKGSWADAPPRQRKRTLQKFADLIVKHADELALLETVDMGKPIGFARSIDINAVAETVRWYAE
ncbi:MAG: aldehyde dehydrogenase family protein, partial [Rhizomicrobium sp.]